jgi:hypothetical protein
MLVWPYRPIHLFSILFLRLDMLSPSSVDTLSCFRKRSFIGTQEGAQATDKIQIYMTPLWCAQASLPHYAYYFRFRCPSYVKDGGDVSGCTRELAECERSVQTAVAIRQAQDERPVPSMAQDEGRGRHPASSQVGRKYVYAACRCCSFAWPHDPIGLAWGQDDDDETLALAR